MFLHVLVHLQQTLHYEYEFFFFYNNVPNKIQTTHTWSQRCDFETCKHVKWLINNLLRL